MNVTRPDPASNPRTFEITFGLKEGNGVVDGTEIRKTFEYRSLRDDNDAWTGLVSEPVEIKWTKQKKDLTGGINGLAKAIFDIRKKRVAARIEEKRNGNAGKGKSAAEVKKGDDKLAELELELEEKLNQNQSFFNWFSWTGEYFMTMEREAEIRLKEERKAKGEDVLPDEADDEDSDGLDVFPDGEKLAYLIAEDMFPNAMKHFGKSSTHPMIPDGFVF